MLRSILSMAYYNLFNKCLWKSESVICSVMSNPMDCSPPGSSDHGILQASILEWAAIPFFKGFSQSKDWTHVTCIAGRFFFRFFLSHQESLINVYRVACTCHSCRYCRLICEEDIHICWYKSLQSIEGSRHEQILTLWAVKETKICSQLYLTSIFFAVLTTQSHLGSHVFIISGTLCT